MIEVLIPNNFLPERKYILSIFFDEFLGIKHQVKIADVRDYHIVLDNQKKIIIRDHFFSNFDEGSAYLDKKNIPAKVKFLKNQFVMERDIPVIYGNDELSIKKDEITCGIDLFNSSFFMLTRWEEFVNNIRDSHNRFLGSESLACKSGFLDRPVVNEYVEMFWNLLNSVKSNLKRKKRTFKIIVTHDVDSPLKWLKHKDLLRVMGGDILKRKSFSLAFSSLKNYFQSQSDSKNDPFNTFSFIMDTSEKLNLKSHFFLKSTKKGKYDSYYYLENEFVKNLIKEIAKRGHLIGFHPGYYTYNNLNLWQKEYKDLSKHVPHPLICGRQHYLRFEIPTTWQIWNDNNMEWDSTLGYADKEGFRCGTCYEFNVFNIRTQQKLRLKEKPLTVMEKNFFEYQDVSLEYVKGKTRRLIEKVKKYNGNFVFLWHNSSFYTPNWNQYHQIYEEIIQK